jgi:hypothetical protein
MDVYGVGAKQTSEPRHATGNTFYDVKTFIRFTHD